MFCEICGTKLSENEQHCSNCNEPNPDYRSTSPVNNSLDNPEHKTNSKKVSNVKNRKKLTSGVILSDDERLVRSYICSELSFPKCVGHLSVTTRRVIFHGTSSNSRVVDEVALDSISGISTFYGSKILFKRIIIGLIALFASIMMISQNVSASQQSSSWGFAATSPSFPPLLIIAGFVVAVVCFILSHRKVFFLKIYSSKATAAPIIVGEGYGGTGGNSAVYAISARPTSETDAMMKELGATINDIQMLGDLGVEQWKK